MRSSPPDFELRPARDLGEALELLDREPGVWRPFAGGTDIMVLFEAGKLAHRKYVNIWNLPGLRGIAETGGHVTLGALATYAEVLRSETLRAEFPMLCRAAAETGAVAIQNRGTIGGNIANASPAADTPPALLCYDAEVELASARGSRWVPYRSFHTGYKTTVMEPRDLITRIRLPRRTAGLRHYYRKVGTRKAQAISKVVFAGAALLQHGKIAHARVALGSVAPVTVRCVATEAALIGRAPSSEVAAAARSALSAEIGPISDIRSTTAYRSKVAQNLLTEFVNRLTLKL